MARIFITGSASGLGLETARTLRADGHDVIGHARADADVAGDLAELDQVRDVAAQVNRLGPVDAVIHNAGVGRGPEVLAVNVLAPYLLTALIDRPPRLVYLSSGMHEGGRVDLTRLDGSLSYSDSKLFVTTLALAVARLWPGVFSNAVDPGWVPTRMGGPNAPDDLRLGHLTQEWLATSEDAEARTSGGYWYHQQRRAPHPAALDPGFQDDLLAALARLTDTQLPARP